MGMEQSVDVLRKHLNRNLTTVFFLLFTLVGLLIVFEGELGVSDYFLVGTISLGYIMIMYGLRRLKKVWFHEILNNYFFILFFLLFFLAKKLFTLVAVSTLDLTIVGIWFFLLSSLITRIYPCSIVEEIR